MIKRKTGNTATTEEDFIPVQKKSRLGNLPDLHEKDENENFNQFNMGHLGGPVEEKRDLNKKQTVTLGAAGYKKEGYESGSYSGLNSEFKRSPKLNQDPIIELRHIIGYSPDRCLNLRWSRHPNDTSTVIFTSGGTLIAMDLENNQQKRFFFGHSAPICCFDVNANGALIASA
jgi:hypothetical protein